MILEIPVVHEGVGKVTLTVDLAQKPSWFGDFQTGKLAIYKGTTVGTPLQPMYSLIAVTTDEHFPATSGQTYAMYKKEVPLDMAVEHFLKHVSNVYADATIRARNAAGIIPS